MVSGAIECVLTRAECGDGMAALAAQQAEERPPSFGVNV